MVLLEPVLAPYATGSISRAGVKRSVITYVKKFERMLMTQLRTEIDRPCTVPYAQEPVLNVLRALILVPMFVLVFDDEPRAAGATADAAWGWHISLKVQPCTKVLRSPPLS